jgi:hypothetical protein
MGALAQERMVLMNYIVQVEISVEADDDDAALFWVQDTIGFSGFSMVRWIDTRLSERESNE